MPAIPRRLTLPLTPAQRLSGSCSPGDALIAVVTSATWRTAGNLPVSWGAVSAGTRRDLPMLTIVPQKESSGMSCPHSMPAWLDAAG